MSEINKYFWSETAYRVLVGGHFDPKTKFKCLFSCQLYSQPGCADFDVNRQKYSLGCLPVLFFSDFENFNLMTSWRPFYINPFRHSHGCKLALIFFKFAHDVAYLMGLFAIENQQDWAISSIQNGVPRIVPAAILDPKIKISQNVKTKGRLILSSTHWTII